MPSASPFAADMAPLSAAQDRPWWHDAVAFVVALGLPLLAGTLGGWLTASSVETWYPMLDKPAFTPPGRVIGAVWTVLYVVMGVAAYRVWRVASGDRLRRPAALFGLQLVLNVGWSAVFFGLQSPGGALVEILALGAAVAATMRAFWRVDRWAGGLMVPYLAWVGFATILNAAIWWMN